MSEQASVKMDVTITKNPGRGSGYTASYGQYPRSIEAHGATQGEAKANLTAALNVALRTMIEVKPAFARDDEGAVWAALPAADGGSTEWRITNGTARQIGSACSAPAQAFGGCIGMTAIPNA